MKSIIEYSLCVYWGIRPESREVVADKMAVYLNRLAALDDSFLSWYSQGNKKSEKYLLQKPFDKDAIALMLTTQRTETDHKPMPELGFGFWAWSGMELKFNARISAKCGLYTKWLVNSVIISFHRPEFPSMELMKDIFGVMREVFQPEEGVILVDECFISENGEEEYKDRILESFGKIDENGEITINRP